VHRGANFISSDIQRDGSCLSLELVKRKKLNPTKFRFRNRDDQSKFIQKSAGLQRRELSSEGGWTLAVNRGNSQDPSDGRKSITPKGEISKKRIFCAKENNRGKKSEGRTSMKQ